jgi:hypothetical protein
LNFDPVMFSSKGMEHISHLFFAHTGTKRHRCNRGKAHPVDPSPPPNMPKQPILERIEIIIVNVGHDAEMTRGIRH